MLRRAWLLAALLVSSFACTFTNPITPPFTGEGVSSLPENSSELPTPQPTATPTPLPTPLPAVRIEQADRYIFYGDYEKALQEYQIAYEGAADSETRAAALVGVGHANYLLRKYQEATQALITVIEYYPDSSHRANAVFFLGQCFSALGNHQQAAEAYGNYASLKPGVLDAYVLELRGDEFAAMGDPQKAIEAYEAAKLVASGAAQIGLQVKVANQYAALGDNENALRRYMDIYQNTTNDYTKAQMDLLVGRIYLALGETDQAYARFMDAVENYPKAYDSYSALVALVEAGVPVDDIDRGLVNYFARQYGLAIDAFKRYLDATPVHDGTAHYYKGLAHQAIGDYENAIAEWNALIRDHAGDRFWIDAWEDKVFTLWFHLQRYQNAANELLQFVNLYPTADQAGSFLYQAGRLLERAGSLVDAAATWERMITEYPSNELSYRGLFLAGVTRYRLMEYGPAQITFQRALVLATETGDSAAAYYWIAKTLAAQGDVTNARSYWEKAAQADPMGYYSERAAEALEGKKPFSLTEKYDLTVDWDEERKQAENWFRSTFVLEANTDLSGLGALASDRRVLAADALWELGMYREADALFDQLREEIKGDPVNCYRLLNHVLELGFYRQAILLSRQILDLAQVGENRLLTAPLYFNHIRFGLYYKDMVLDAAKRENFHPFLLFALIRQESFFDGFAGSVAGARGVMQIMPATGQDIAKKLGYPANFTADDLDRPNVSIRLGVYYLAQQRTIFGGNVYKALAAYNAGAGKEMQEWSNIAGDDPDLFLEVIRYAETRRYVQQIVEFAYVYQHLYGN